MCITLYNQNKITNLKINLFLIDFEGFPPCQLFQFFNLFQFSLNPFFVSIKVCQPIKAFSINILTPNGVKIEASKTHVPVIIGLGSIMMRVSILSPKHPRNYGHFYLGIMNFKMNIVL